MDIELVKMRELEIMKEFHRVCELLQCRYILAFGSMIGCIRHDGFIPWDDDIDVTMPYEDYEKFIAMSGKYLGSQYFLQTSQSDPGYQYPYTKIRLKNSCVLSSYPPSGRYSEHGIYIDIFPAMRVPQSKIKQKMIKISNLVWSQISRFDSKIIIRASKRSVLGKSAMYVCYFLNRFLPNGFPNEMLFKNALKVKEKETEELYIGDFYSELNSINDYRLPRDVFENRFLHQFEDTMFYMPKDYDSIMRKMYGNYMELPPVEKRKSHGFVYVSDKISFAEYKKNRETNNVTI